MDGDCCELVGFGFRPYVLGEVSESPGKNDERRPTLEVEVGGAVGYAQVVAAQGEYTLGFFGLMVHVMVVPQYFGEMYYFRIDAHNIC